MTCAAIAAIGLHLASMHPGATRDFNDTNPGLYVRTECGITVGAYHNSLSRVSVHASYSTDIRGTPLFVTAGAVTGYRLPVSPLVMAGVRQNIGPLTVRVGYLPKVQKVNNSHVVHFMIERRF